MSHVGEGIQRRGHTVASVPPRGTKLVFMTGPDHELLMKLLSFVAFSHFHYQVEVMASRHKDDNSVACIVDKCYVLSYPEYCR